MAKHNSYMALLHILGSDDDGKCRKKDDKGIT